ncbi:MULTISPECIES: DUF2267 domain-containing protein [Chitinophaga]|jgi:hypothetical protein|uniref:DUF2267 domain-containing protein n=1 Tax=Chitinophaga caseinilytica TaxID=2267521 RepID=A0ABZ2Z5T1_9BACT|nr:DUF2267 domain-containing protein [Chitinophaga rhizosphaerae]
MQELIQQVKDKAGVNDEQAVKAIEAVKDFVKSKLPPMIAGNVDVWFAGMAGGAQPKKPDAAEDFLD